MQVYRTEYPNPQFEREDWVCLNGEWEFEIDAARSGMERKLYEAPSLAGTINVPFCPESPLSGVGNTDFMDCVWYRKEIAIPAAWRDKHVVLHFGAVDYHAIVFVNGKQVGEHKGGYTSFSFDITACLTADKNVITLCAYDDLRSGNQPAGKQSGSFKSFGCYYTRTTGIWQSVWLTSYDETCVKSMKLYPNIESCALDMQVTLSGKEGEATVRACAFYEDRAVGSVSVTSDAPLKNLHMTLSEKHLWELGCGRLYDLYITVERNGKTCDTVKSYFGMRSLGLQDKTMTLNGKKFFGRWVLDQGFYPDGIYTAPTEEALKNDILYSMQLGFNGARLHQKIYEPRFLYWADKLGYSVWGEHASWGMRFRDASQLQNFLPEWLEAIERDFNHPSIIGWCPLNETWDYSEHFGAPTVAPCTEIFATIYQATKLYDSTRPCIDASGGFHVITDFYDMHDYEQDPKEFKARFGSGDTFYEQFPKRQQHKGEPFFVSEYGGIKWSDAKQAWGYGDAPKTEAEFIERYRGLTDALLDNKHVFGFCYTQLYDVEQEQNGLMTYERKFKFDPKIFYEINTRKAAAEED